jgi:hypothetical protein
LPSAEPGAGAATAAGAAGRKAAPLEKRLVRKEDGRYLIFYERPKDPPRR